MPRPGIESADGIKTPAQYLGHCASLWMEDWNGEDFQPTNEEFNYLVETLKEAIDYTDYHTGKPLEKPWDWLWGRVEEDWKSEGKNDVNVAAEVLEIVEVLSRGDLALAVEVVNEYRLAIQ